MAKADTANEPAGMEKADIKRHLRFAKDEPVSVAFALGGDGKAILQLDRRKPGRALERHLKEAAPDSKNHRWGFAVVDPDDEKTVRFTVNKAGGGLARKLIVALKGTGFNKVKIQLEDGTELEAHEEEDTDEPSAAEAQPARSPAAAGPSEPPPKSQPGPAAPDAAALAKDLTGLVKRMLGVIAKDGTQKAALAELATDAQASLKRGDLEQASAGIDILREAIADGEAGIASHGGASQGSASQGGASQGGATPGPAGHEPSSPPATPKQSHATAPNEAPMHQKDAQPDLKKEAEAILAALTGAVKKIMPMVRQVPGLGELVKTVVPAVQSAINAGQVATAKSALQELLDAVARNESQGGGGGQPDKAHHEHAAKHAPAIDKASIVWNATRQKVMAEVQKLEKAFTAAIDGHGLMDDLTKTLRTKLDGTLNHLDDRLMHTLSAVNKSPDAADRAKHVDHAHKLVQHYQKHVTEDKTIKMLDANPFYPLAIAKIVTSSLEALQKNIH